MKAIRAGCRHGNHSLNCKQNAGLAAIASGKVLAPAAYESAWIGSGSAKDPDSGIPRGLVTRCSDPRIPSFCRVSPKHGGAFREEGRNAAREPGPAGCLEWCRTMAGGEMPFGAASELFAGSSLWVYDAETMMFTVLMVTATGESISSVTVSLPSTPLAVSGSGTLS